MLQLLLRISRQPFAILCTALFGFSGPLSRPSAPFGLFGPAVLKPYSGPLRLVCRDEFHASRLESLFNWSIKSIRCELQKSSGKTTGLHFVEKARASLKGANISTALPTMPSGRAGPDCLC